MLNVNAFVLLLGLELNSRRAETAETNNFIVWPNDDIRTVAMSTENYGLAVACFQVYYGITIYTQYNILYAYMSQSLVLKYFWVTTRLKIKSNKLMNILL